MLEWMKFCPAFIVGRTIYEKCTENMCRKFKNDVRPQNCSIGETFLYRRTSTRRGIGEALHKNSLKSAQSYLSFLQLFTTSPDNATKPMTFGITMSWLKVSVSSQTRSLERREPRKIKRIAMME